MKKTNSISQVVSAALSGLRSFAEMTGSVAALFDHASGWLRQ